MLYHGLLVVTILLAGLMVGNELTVALFLHPTLAHFSDNLHAPTRRAFAALFGRVMPFWYVAVVLLTIAVTWLGPPLRSMDGKLLMTSSVLCVITIVFTVIFPAPLNSRIAAWQLQSLPATWQNDRRRWDHLHAFRMVLLLLALLCLITSAVFRG